MMTSPPPYNTVTRMNSYSLECFRSCFSWDITNVFYLFWFVATALLVHTHASRKTNIDSVLTALYVCVAAAALSFLHSHVLNVEESLDGRWIMLWMFGCFTACWALSNLIGDADLVSDSSVLYTKARPLLVMPKRGAVEREERPVSQRPYHEAIRKLKDVERPRRHQSAHVTPIFSQLRAVWFVVILITMLVLKHALEVDMDSVVMICWIAFAVMTTMIERYLGLKRWLVTTYRRFKPTHDARSPWRVVDDRLPSSSFTPLLVFVNAKSGGNLGQVLLQHVEELSLNELQVWNMSWGDPIYALRPFDECLRSGRKLRVLVCGGDGTVAWVLGPTGVGALPEELRKLVAVAVLPLGTGNDLARALGWGSGYSGARGELKEIIGELMRAHEVLLDRWSVVIESPRKRGRMSSFAIRRSSSKKNVRKQSSSRKMEKKLHIMNNYVGFGCGAQVSLNFHTRRERCKWLFQSQLFNKFIYALIGGSQVIQHALRRFLANDKDVFPRSIRLVCDGRPINLDGYEGIIILNIPYYGGGMNVWRHAMEITPASPALRPRDPSSFSSTTSSSSFSADLPIDMLSSATSSSRTRGSVSERKMEPIALETKSHRNSVASNSSNSSNVGRGPRTRGYRTKACQSFNDGLLEVVGVRMANLAVGQIGLPTGERLAQCAKIDIELTRRLAMQIDGEPEMLEAGGKLKIRLHHQAWMFQRSKEITTRDASVLTSILQWGVARKILTNDQCGRLNKELTRRMFEATKNEDR